MAITLTMIEKSSDHLNEKMIELWLLYFRKLKKYKDYAVIYSQDIKQRLEDADGTIKARFLNAAMKEIDELGVGEVEIRRDDEGTYWSLPVERLALIEEAFDILYDDISTMVTSVTDSTISGGTRAAHGQRVLPPARCSSCGCYYVDRGGLCECL